MIGPGSGPKPQIRPKAFCVFRHGDRILVGHGFDSVKQEPFYRPLGGAIEFGERAAETLRREIREELGVEIVDPRLIGVLETIFTCEGVPGHEVVFVFDARFSDKELYARSQLAVAEEGWQHRATWERISELAAGAVPIYPEGLLSLLDGNKVL